MLEYLELLVGRYDKMKDAAARRAFVRNLIAADALHNLDLIAVLRLKSLREKSGERRKVLLCFRSNAERLLESLGLSAAEVLEGEFPEIVDTLNRASAPNGVRLHALEDFERQSDLWLYSFANRKVRILRELAERDLDVENLLHLQHRLKNAGLAFQALAQRLRTPKAV